MKKVVFFVLIIATVLMFSGCTVTEVRSNNVSQTDSEENLVVLQHDGTITVRQIIDLKTNSTVFSGEEKKWASHKILLQPGSYSAIVDIRRFVTNPYTVNTQAQKVIDNGMTEYRTTSPVPLFLIAEKNEAYEIVSSLTALKSLQVNIKKIEKN